MKREADMSVAETPLPNGDNGLAETRDSKGRFLPGNPGGPGNPQARNVATWRKALADAVSAADVAQVTRKLVDAAKAGESWAVRELLDRLLGKPHVQIELQADADYIREYSETEKIEAARLSRLLLMEERAADAPEAPGVPASQGAG